MRLPGLHTVRSKLADGSTREYHYAWRGGPQIKAQFGTNAFAAEYHRLIENRPQKRKFEFMADLIREYRQSPEYSSVSTKRDYERAIQRILERYHDLPIPLLDQRGMRAEFIDWRDTMSDRPRTADFTIAILARILAFGVDREIIDTNKAAKIAKLHKITRRDSIWTRQDMRRFRRVSPRHICQAVTLALWTMQRQGDLLAMEWDQWNGSVISLVQGKTGARVRLRAARPLRLMLDRMERRSDRILTNINGEPWTNDGFRSSFRYAMQDAGLQGRLTFHDLRGTGITRTYAAGFTIRDISAASGHSETHCEQIIRRHYLAADFG